MELNYYSLLNWETSDIRYTVNFMDLQISIYIQGKFSFKIYQKAMNLYFCLLPHSTHPTRCIKGIFLNFFEYIGRKKSRGQTTYNFRKTFPPSHLRRTYHNKPSTTLPRCRHPYQPIIDLRTENNIQLWKKIARLYPIQI